MPRALAWRIPARTISDIKAALELGIAPMGAAVASAQPAELPHVYAEDEDRSFRIVPSTNVLNSWKEIASYMRLGVRTVQRWEQELSLPIHRISDTPRSSVFAFINELEQWRGSRVHQNEQVVAPSPAARASALQLRAAELCARTRALQDEVLGKMALLRGQLAELRRVTCRARCGSALGRELAFVGASRSPGGTYIRFAG